MTILSTVFAFSTVFALPLAATATPTPQPLAVSMPVTESAASSPDLRRGPTLRNLQAEMHRTGQVAVPNVRSDGKGVLVAAPIAQRPETKVRSVLAAPPKKTSTWALLRDDPTLDVQYGKEFTASVERCRFDVARRDGIAPSEIAAGVVTLRWTIEPSGRVRDVSVVARSPTDEGVTECAKKIVASRVLLNPVEKPLALELTYSFRKIPAAIHAEEGSPNDR